MKYSKVFMLIRIIENNIKPELININKNGGDTASEIIKSENPK